MAISAVRGRRRSVGQAAQQPDQRISISDIVKAIRKDHGDKAIIMGNEKRQPTRISTRIFSLDLALLGGIFAGCINEFKGAKHSGKTTACFKVISAAQKQYPTQTVAFVDAEHAFDAVWAGKLGVDCERLLVVQPVSGEEAVDQIQGLMSHPGICLVVLDSVATLTPMKEVEQATEDANVGIHAKLVTKMVRKVLASISQAAKEGREVTFLCTNQQRAGIGKWAPPGQEAISDPGGKALAHFTVLEAKFKNKEVLKRDEDSGSEELTVNEHAFSIEKNKWNAGIRKGEFLLQRTANDQGLVEGDIDDAAAMLAFAKRMGMYTGGGRAWTLSIPDFQETKGSAAEWVDELYSDRDLHQRLRNHLIAVHAAKLGMPEYMIDRIYEQELP